MTTEDKNDLGGVSPTEGAAVSCSVPPDAATARRDYVQEAITELDAILRNDRKCFAEDSDADEFLGHVTNARLALAKIGHPLFTQPVWQPIDTAPKDGTWVLLYCPGGVGCVVAAYMTLDIEWWFVDTGKEEWPLRGPSPTHWMPLPEPPQ